MSTSTPPDAADVLPTARPQLLPVGCVAVAILDACHHGDTGLGSKAELCLGVGSANAPANWFVCGRSWSEPTRPETAVRKRPGVDAGGREVRRGH